ncbi:MAG: hypothetical protein K2K20_12915, partial [Lachnospiraceae bacterium]|nr:hypothetical protein [Lachnospiraceae bacterium]
LGIILAVLLLGAGGFFAWRSIENSNIESGEAVIMAFMKDYDRLRLEDAYELFHPDVREEIIEDQLDNYSVSDLEELEDFLDMYYGGLELEYEINKSKRLSKEELEDILSEVYHTFRVRLDISKAYAYQVTETFSGENGTLKIIEQYVVGKEDGEWYIIAVSTVKVVKDNVTFTLPEEDDEPIDILEAFMEEYNHLNLEAAYQLFHPDVRDVLIELFLDNASINSLEEYGEALSDYFGGFSMEYEILQSSHLSDSELEDCILDIERFYEVQIDSDFSDACVYEIRETFSGDNGTAVQIQRFYFGKEDGNWYILDIITDERTDDVQSQNPGDSVSGYDDSDGFDSGEEALDQFISEYLIDLKESYNAAHPMLRDTYLQLTLELFNASSVEEYNDKMASAFGDSTLTYEINAQYPATDEELEIYLSYIYGTYGVQLDLSECILYSITLEIHEPNDETVDFTEEIVVGKDGDKWYVIEGLIGY